MSFQLLFFLKIVLLCLKRFKIFLPQNCFSLANSTSNDFSPIFKFLLSLVENPELRLGSEPGFFRSIWPIYLFFESSLFSILEIQYLTEGSFRSSLNYLGFTSKEALPPLILIIILITQIFKITSKRLSFASSFIIPYESPVWVSSRLQVSFPIICNIFKQLM